MSADLFQLNGSNYLVLVDHYSDYIELEPLTNTSAVTVIRAMKRNFARLGIPDECVTDNGSQISTIYGLIIDPHNIQLSVGPIVQLMKRLRKIF